MRVLLFTTLLLLIGCHATGTSIVTGETRQEIDPEFVKLYLDPPENYETIGLVEASAPIGRREQDAVDNAVMELKNQAAMLGANGVILTSTSETATTIIDNVGNFLNTIIDEEKNVTGKAIFVN